MKKIVKIFVIIVAIAVLSVGSLLVGNMILAGKTADNLAVAAAEQKDMKLTVLGEKKDISYSSTDISKDGNNYNMYTYYDDKHNEYSIAPDANGVFVYFNENELTPYFGVQTPSKELADKYFEVMAPTVKDLFNEDVMAKKTIYTFIKEEPTSGGDYITYYYQRIINDMKTNEGVYIQLDQNGCLHCYMAVNIGKFDKVKIDKIDINAVDKAVTDELNGRYKDSTISDIEIGDQILNIINGKVVINNSVGITVTDNDGNQFQSVEEVIIPVDKN